MSLLDKVIHSERFEGGHDFIYQLDLVHRDYEGPHGGCLSLEMRLCDRTDTATQSVQIINIIRYADLDEMVEALKRIQGTLAKTENAIDTLDRAKRLWQLPIKKPNQTAFEV